MADLLTMGKGCGDIAHDHDYPYMVRDFIGNL